MSLTAASTSGVNTSVMSGCLTIFANISRQAHVRVGIGKHNQPELRASRILAEIQGEISKMIISFDSTPLRNIQWLCNIHDPAYLSFLEDAYASLMNDINPDWMDGTNGLIPNMFYKKKPIGMNTKLPVYKMTGYYASDYMTPIYSDTYSNVMLAASQAYRAASQAGAAGGVNYALTCSPGHHAKYEEYGGYCFLNNGAIAAYRLSEFLPGNIGILDLDYHHGSTTIIEENPRFKERFFACSIHGNPNSEYPTFEGHYEQSNDRILNIPLDGGTTWETYLDSLQETINFLKDKKIVGLVIAFGADTYKDDPDVGEKYRLALVESDYLKMGSLLKNHFEKLPIVVTQEGGYNIDHVGAIVCQFLKGLTGQN